MRICAASLQLAMITSIVRLAADPWSRRQQPIRVPKIWWFDRHPRFTVVVIGIGGTCLAFSRFIYDAFNSMFEPDDGFLSDSRLHDEVIYTKHMLQIVGDESKPTLDLVMLMHQTHWRKDGERPKSLQEAFEEQKKIRKEQQKEKERQAQLALRL